MVAGATLAAARAVWSGAAEHGASQAGGLGRRNSPSARQRLPGVYNNLASAIPWLLRAGRRKHRLREHRRAPRRRGTGRVLRRPAGADDRPTAGHGDAVPVHRPARRDRRAQHEEVGERRHYASRARSKRARSTPSSTRSIPPLLQQFQPGQLFVDQHQHRPAPAEIRWRDLELSASTLSAAPKARARRSPLTTTSPADARWSTGGAGDQAGAGRTADLDAPARRGHQPPSRSRDAARPRPGRGWTSGRTGLASHASA